MNVEDHFGIGLIIGVIGGICIVLVSIALAGGC